MTPSRPARLRAPLSRVLTGMATAALLLGGSAAWSNAATVPSAITDVAIRQDTTTAGSAMTLDVRWRVPDGTRGGDTFTLTLPPELSALDGTSFDLADGGGAVVATAVVRDRDVLFTVTDYAQHHIGVHGSAFFTVQLSRSLQPGPHDLVFRAAGLVFRDVIQVRPQPDDDYSTSATKWARWIPAGTPGIPAPDRIHWAITGPRVAGLAPVTFTDTPGPGQAIDCASLTMWSGTANISGELVGKTFVPTNHYTVLECGVAKAVVRLTPRSSDVGRIFMLMGMSRLTDDKLAQYTNSGSVAIGNGAIPVLTVLPGAGGQGTGTTPATPPPPAPGTATSTAPVPGPSPTGTAPGATETGTATPPGGTETGTGPATTPVESTSSTAPPVAGGTSVPGTTSPGTVDPIPSTPATSPPAPGSPAPTRTAPPVATPSDLGTTNPVIRPGKPTPLASRAGARVTTVNTGIAPVDETDSLLVGGGVVLLAGAGAGLVTMSRRRGRG